MFLELYRGALRLIVSPDIREEEPLIIDLAGAREDSHTEGHHCVESVWTNPEYGERTDGDL